MKCKFVLGSSSRWRQDIAKNQLGVEVELMPPDIDEREAAKGAKDGSPEAHTSVIAAEKIASLLPKLKEDNMIVMCFDTIVYSGSKILEKPKDMDECIAMVKGWAKAGNRIEVYTAVAVARNTPLMERSSVERADIVMTKDLDDAGVETYIKKSFAIESSGAVIVEDLIEMGVATVDGDQSVIEGLPINAVRRFIDEIDK